MNYHRLVVGFVLAIVVGTSLRMLVAEDAEQPDTPPGLIQEAMKKLQDLYYEQSQELSSISLEPASSYLESLQRYTEQTEIATTAFDQAALDILNDTLQQLKSLLYIDLTEQQATTLYPLFKKEIERLLKHLIGMYRQNLLEARDKVLNAPLIAQGETVYSLKDLARRDIRNTLGEPEYRRLADDVYSASNRIKDAVWSFANYFKESYSDIAKKVYDDTIKGSRTIIKKKIAEEDARLQRQIRRDLGLNEPDGQYYYVPRLGRAVRSRGDEA